MVDLATYLQKLDMGCYENQNHLGILRKTKPDLVTQIFYMLFRSNFKL